jgi:proline iminopeptidase
VVLFAFVSTFLAGMVVGVNAPKAALTGFLGRRQVPVRERWVSAGGAELFVRRVGDAGSTLLTVHGGPGLSHELLAPLEALAPALTVVGYDQRGTGRSTGAVDRERVLDEAVADLGVVQADLGTAPVHLLGHSWGGLVAALYAAAHPERVAGLVLIDSIPPTGTALAAAMERLRARVRDFQVGGLVPHDLGRSPDEQLLAILPAYYVDPAHPGARTLGGAHLNADTNAVAGAALANYDVRARLRGVRGPVLHFIASVPFGAGMAGAMAEAVPGARVLLTDAGHFPFVERPATFFARLRAFLGGAA